jgi:hypothetical protein
MPSPIGGWPIDTHPPEGVDAPNEPPCTQHHLPYLYDIPLRCCVSAGPRNLMFAGRNISATHIAFASTRVMATCAVIGQGVGTAAALALRQNVLPADIAADAKLVHAIQQQLLRDDCYLIGVSNDDPKDLVRIAATITASSFQSYWQENEGRRMDSEILLPSLSCQQSIRSGQTRIVTKLPGHRQHPGLHRWMSGELPATLEIRWDAPVSLSEVVLVFDTGLHRLLTLSQADGYTQKMLWGRPQPETVRDYALSLESPTGWQTIESIQNNHQRLRRHFLPETMTTTALRIHITATNGLDHARVVEVRAYA